MRVQRSNVPEAAALLDKGRALDNAYVGQAFQPAIRWALRKAGWKACPTRVEATTAAQEPTV